ncbi:Hypothetical predicted protein [Paramuricea clavata]|uniref:Uncharacterized protein n=1 Tax=Paramuricea clavata TaxID=317549 RepID=A0A6S7FP10_PARCT|nr:Hypothetical predicted protein [Paramuricea clavata]
MAINEAERPSRTRLSRNIDGAREEKLRSLKASNSAYRGAITRVQKRIEQLMTDRSNYEEVQVEKASLDKTFMSYSKCCQDIKDCLYEDEVTELREIAKGYTNVCNAKEHLDRKLGEWIAIADVDLKTNFKERFEPSELTTFRVNEHERLTTSNEFAYPNMRSDGHLASDIGSRGSSLNRVSPGMTELQYFKSRNEMPESRRKVGVIRSTQTSVASESASIRRAKAELEKQRYMEMQEIERQQQAIDHQLELVQIKQEMESKRAELQRRRELIELENDIGRAKLEEEAEKLSINYTKSEARDDSRAEPANQRIGLRRELAREDLSEFTKPLNSKVIEKPRRDSHIRKMEKFQSQEIRVPDSHPPQNAPAKQNVTWSNESVSEVSPRRIKREEGSYGAGESDPLYRVLQSQQESLILMANTLGSSIRRGFEMPKRVCLGFDGNPMNYPKFIENFKTNIEEREQEPRSRLAYLIQLCSGIAKDQRCH